MEWPLLAALADDERNAVLSAARKRSYGKGEIVFHEGDRSDSLHLIVSGHLAVRVSTPDGERATLNVLGPGGWFGELSLLRDQVVTPRAATVQALDKSQTLILTHAAFHTLCERHPSIERFVAVLMADQIRSLNTHLLRAMYVGLDRRLFHCLLELCEVYGTPDERTVIPLPQEQLAEMVGGTRPSVNQVLQRLVAEGIVELGRGRVTVVDPARLESLAGL